MLWQLHKDRKNTPSRSGLKELFSVGRLAVWKEDIHIRTRMDDVFSLQRFARH